ncbi:MAG: hypothetical protein AB7D28_00995 [Candidatus Berkiella sp.]
MRDITTFEAQNVSGGTGGVVEATIVLGTVMTAAIIVAALSNPYPYSYSYSTYPYSYTVIDTWYDPYPYYYDEVVVVDYYYY